MAEETKITGLIKVPALIHTKIKKRAERNFRSIPKEVEFLLNTVEKLEKKNELSKLTDVAYTEES
jgi:hypothetical protein